MNMYCYKKYLMNAISADEVLKLDSVALLLNRLKIKFTIFYHLLSLVLCEVEDDDVRAVPPLREGEQPPVLVDGERGQVLPPAGGQFKKVRSRISRCKINGDEFMMLQNEPFLRRRDNC